MNQEIRSNRKVYCKSLIKFLLFNPYWWLATFFIIFPTFIFIMVAPEYLLNNFEPWKFYLIFLCMLIVSSIATCFNINLVIRHHNSVSKEIILPITQFSNYFDILVLLIWVTFFGFIGSFWILIRQSMLGNSFQISSGYVIGCNILLLISCILIIYPTMKKYHFWFATLVWILLPVFCISSVLYAMNNATEPSNFNNMLCWTTIYIPLIFIAIGILINTFISLKIYFNNRKRINK